MGRLDGRVAIVAGAAMGIGKATSALMAREGAKVALTDVDMDACRKAAEEIASTILFPAPDGSSAITASEIVVDGGYTAR